MRHEWQGQRGARRPGRLPALAKGMPLVAACPVGLLANLSHHLACANAALSVTSPPRPPWRERWLCL